MSSDLHSPLRGAHQKANQAAASARPDYQSVGEYWPILRGKVTGTAGGNSYAVDVLDSTGATLASFESVYVYPPGTEFETDERVVLVMMPGAHVPFILSAGGDCAAGLTDFGVLID